MMPQFQPRHIACISPVETVYHVELPSMKTMLRASVAPQFRAIENTPQKLTSLEQVDLTPADAVFPSPRDWADQVLYFLLPDRFSDGNEHQRPLFDRHHPENFRPKSLGEWM